MGEKKWRNLGSPLLGNLNFVLAVGLFWVGFLFWRFPHWTGDTDKSAPQTAATLVGALWGSAALLLGAWVNEGIRHRDEVRKNSQKAKNFNKILFAQFRSVINNMTSLVCYIKFYIENSNEEPSHMNLEIALQNSFLSHDFMYENLSLLRKYIEVLIQFHQSVEALRYETMFFLKQSNSVINVEIAHLIRRDLDIVFQSAVALAESMWPNEQIKIRGKTENLVEYLKRILKIVRELRISEN